MSYNEIVPPDVAGLDLGFVREIWPDSGEVMSALYAGGGVIGGLMLAKAVEKFVGSKIPRFLIPVVHATLGIAAAKAASRWSAPVGVGAAGAFGAIALVRAFDIYFGYKIELSGFDGADLGGISDLLGGAEVLPPELAGLDGLAIEERNMNGLGQVQVETVGWRS